MQPIDYSYQIYNVWLTKSNAIMQLAHVSIDVDFDYEFI